MKLPRLRDVPPRATILVVVLALLASVVTGAPWTSAPPPPADTAKPETALGGQPVLEPLDMASLERRKTIGTVPDLFKIQALPPPVAKDAQVALAPQSPPPAPVAPALPFKYLGRMSDSERTVVFLESGQSLYSVAVGDTVANTYRVEAISASSVTFRYLPLDLTQTLVVPAAP